jgi:TolB-like protein/DNA-binding winged helix-turn-helix (wHTH) protein/Tfp pilus assembly protein PilF
MGSQERHLYEFGEFRLDTAERLLLKGGKPLPLPPKVFDTLVLLVRNSGHLLDKDQLMKELWPDAFVEEVNLSVNISALRKVLGFTDAGQQYIDTIPKCGYRFVADVRELADESPDLIVHNRIRARMITEEVGTGQAELEQTQQEKFLTTVHSPRVNSRRKLVAAVLAGSALVLALVLASPYFRSASWRAGTSAPPVRVNSMAVLPFKPLSQSSDDQYLELGIADDLINKLSNLNQIVVRPTSAVRSYTESGQDPIAAGKELKVDAVLEGNIQKLGDRIRVTARLVSVPDGRALWSDKFDENLSDMFTVEDSISERVAEAVMPRLSGEDRKLLTKRQPESPEAHEAYLRGRYFWNKRTEAALNKANEYFQRAIDIDPNYALAYCGIADCYMSLYDFQFRSPEDSVPKAKAAATKALEIDGTLPEAHASVARLNWLYDRDRAKAESEFLRAIELNPNCATARQWHSRYLADLGRFDEAIIEMKRAQELDPLSLIIGSNLGLIFYYDRKYDPAVEQLQKTLEIEPNFVLAHWLLGNTYERKQMYHEAISEYQKALSLQRDQELGEAIEQRYNASGFDLAMRTLLDTYKKRAKQEWGLAYTAARYSAVLGDKAQAFEWLERAYHDHHPWLTSLKVDPQFDSLHSDRRFADLLRREGLPE